MNVLLVLAHPEPRSFNGALRDAARETLSRAGHTVVESDLYAMCWKATLGREDFAAAETGDFFNVQTAQRSAADQDLQTADVAAEQAKLATADLVILIFPIWWFGPPAILKGWIDRVFACGVAYGGGRWFDRGVYRGKRALIACSTGGRADRFSDEALFGPLEWILHPLLVGLLNFCGFDTLDPFVSYAAGNVGNAEREVMLARWRSRLATIETEAPQPFRHLADFADSAMRDHT